MALQSTYEVKMNSKVFLAVWLFLALLFSAGCGEVGQDSAVENEVTGEQGAQERNTRATEGSGSHFDDDFLVLDDAPFEPDLVATFTPEASVEELSVIAERFPDLDSEPITYQSRMDYESRKLGLDWSNDLTEQAEIQSVAARLLATGIVQTIEMS